MRIRNHFGRSIIFYILFIIFGLMMFFMLSPHLSNDVPDGFIETTAIIREIKGTSSDDTHAVLVSYKDLDGNYHYAFLDTYTSSMRIDDQVDIYYNPQNYDYVRKVWKGAEKIVVFLPLIFSAVGIIGLFFNFRSKTDKNTMQKDSETPYMMLEDGEHDHEEEYEIKIVDEGKLIEFYDSMFFKAYEISCDKLSKFKPTLYKFKNNVTEKSYIRTISSNITSGLSSPIGFRSGETFLLENCSIWDFLEHNKLRFEYDTKDLMANRFNFMLDDLLIASIEKQDEGIYRYFVKTNCKYLDIVAIAVFTILRLNETYK